MYYVSDQSDAHVTRRSLRVAMILLAVAIHVSTTAMVARADMEPESERESPSRNYWRMSPGTRHVLATQNLRDNPLDHKAYYRRALANCEFGRSISALRDLLMAHKLDPDNPEYCNAIAWIMATAKEGECRDGGAACLWSLEAIKKSSPPRLRYFDTLAASKAEKGDYAFAVSLQRKVAADCRPSKRKAYRRRLKLYELEMPHREE